MVTTKLVHFKMKSSVLLLPICAALLAFVSASSNPLQEEIVAINAPIMAPVQVEGSDAEIQRPKRQGILGALLHGLSYEGDHHHHHGGHYG